MITSHATDFIIRLKNGYSAGRKNVDAPASNLCIAIAELLKKNGYIKDYQVQGEIKKTINVTLEYHNDNPSITGTRIFSKPGRRVYHKASALPWGSTKKSLIIVSTSNGVISQKDAQKRKIGGEIIAEIY